MRARILRPSKSAMQSGRAKTQEWLLVFAPSEPRRADPLMGWIGSGDTVASQVRLHFPTLEAAEAYARANGIEYVVEPEHRPVLKPKAYADNFRYGRGENWTH
ncbi:ETC complex I subunit [Elioraea rosea]|uniref:ETC complex I subunit n=1 Tax=Elioraea rosea TaxID=2492390 RepID=UPI00118201A7|nr:ETC complex I subunit [Elioraea rosea]